MAKATSLIWFRRDLRVADNPALTAAIAPGKPVAGLYVVDETRHFSPGSAQKWILHHALLALAEDLGRLDIPLLLRKGPEAEMVLDVANELNIACAFWNRRYAAEEIEIDRNVRDSLIAAGITAKSFNGSLLREPWEIKTRTGGPYRIYTPFWNMMRSVGPSRTELPPPAAKNVAVTDPIFSDALGRLDLMPSSPNWANGFHVWRPFGAARADNALEGFLAAPASSYDADRNRPDRKGTSRLSPHLALGTIGPLQVWNRVRCAIEAGIVPESQGLKFLSEIAWREFAYHLLYHNPSMPTAPLRTEFDVFPWRDDKLALRAWTSGRTGVPIVDAGMRELWRTGWMHNRIRMIAASFLVKNLLIPWQKGERWFWNTLIDADPANNPAGWQWVAGCGADAAPYFRIFNPVTQGEKFDPDGAYVRKYVPEIAALPNNLVHAPWRAPVSTTLLDYPKPIVDLDQSRKRSLAAYHQMKISPQTLDSTEINA